MEGHRDRKENTTLASADTENAFMKQYFVNGKIVLYHHIQIVKLGFISWVKKSHESQQIVSFSVHYINMHHRVLG